jgi:hypothetical protein
MLSACCRKKLRRPWLRLVGLVTPETIGEMLMLHQALPSGVRFGPWGPSTGRSADTPAR